MNIPGIPFANCKPRPWRCGDRVLGGDRPLIMGILNVTPDSFHDGGRHASVDEAVRHAEAMLEAGADIIDVGGESSRPGAEAVPEEEELARTRPVVEALVRRFNCAVSIDTVKSKVARAALQEGACIINDISAMAFDPMMLEVPQAFRAGVVLNHIRGTPKDMQKAPVYGDPVAEVAAFLKARVQLLAAMGVSADHIAVDPGIGFGKRVEDNTPWSIASRPWTPSAARSCWASRANPSSARPRAWSIRTGCSPAWPWPCSPRSRGSRSCACTTCARPAKR